MRLSAGVSGVDGLRKWRLGLKHTPAAFFRYRRLFWCGHVRRRGGLPGQGR